MTLRGTVPLLMLLVHAPTAMAVEEKNEPFYQASTTKLETCSKRGITLIVGDLNARIQVQLCDDEEGVRPHAYDASNTTLAARSNEVVQSRHMLVDLLSEQQLLLANTNFENMKETRQRIKRTTNI